MISVWVFPNADPEAWIQVQVVYLGKTSKGVEKKRKAAMKGALLIQILYWMPGNTPTKLSQLDAGAEVL